MAIRDEDIIIREKKINEKRSLLQCQLSNYDNEYEICWNDDVESQIWNNFDQVLKILFFKINFDFNSQNCDMLSHNPKINSQDYDILSHFYEIDFCPNWLLNL